MIRLGRSQTERGCIWCASTASTTEEDVVARWIARLFSERFWPLSPNFAVQRTGSWYDEDDDGSSSAKRVRILLPVCSPCNNDWMSGLENDAKPVLSKLICAEPVAITEVDADVLAPWAYKTLVNAVFERHRRASELVPPSHRAYLGKHRAPPAEVSLVAFGVAGLDTKVRTRVKEVPIHKRGGRQVNTAVVSIVLVGRVAMQLVSHLKAGTPQPTTPAGFQAAAMTMWPPHERMVPAGTHAFAWPPSGAITGDAEFEVIADPDDDEVRAWMP